MGLITVAVEQISGASVAVQALLCDTGAGLLVTSVGSAEWIEREAWICERLGDMDLDLDRSSVSLALGEQIVALHQGKMWADYDIAYGWCAGVALPVQQVHPGESGEQNHDHVVISAT
jgi:hypothetical protein